MKKDLIKLLIAMGELAALIGAAWIVWNMLQSIRP